MSTAAPGVAEAKHTQRNAQPAGWYPLSPSQRGETAADHHAEQGAIAEKVIGAGQDTSVKSDSSRHVSDVESNGNLQYRTATAVGIVVETKAIQRIAKSAG